LQAQNLLYQIFVHYIAFVRFTVWSPSRHHSQCGTHTWAPV